MEDGRLELEQLIPGNMIRLPYDSRLYYVKTIGYMPDSDVVYMELLYNGVSRKYVESLNKITKVS